VYLKEKSEFRTVPFVLFSIVMMCAVNIGMHLKALTPTASAIAIIVWGAIPHWIGLSLAIREGKTAAACIIAIFAGFWSFLSVGLIMFPGDISGALFCVEPGMFLSILVLQYSYRNKPILRYILCGLAALISLLWLAKIITPLDATIPVALIILGVWALTVAFYELKPPLLASSKND
jgi:hypothetical protein